jgi:tetratricopeptide (TPR) repeat protein
MMNTMRLIAAGRGPILSAGAWFLAILAVLGPGGPAVGQEAGPTVGSEVVLDPPEATLMVGDRVVATGRPQRLYRVVRVKGDWLWLASGDVKGWAMSDEVVPFDELMDECNRAIESGDGTAATYFRRGNLWLIKEEWALALADFDQALSRAPNDAAILRNRGLAWAKLKDADRAIADFTAAIQLDPKYAWAYESRGRVWAELGDHDRAVADYSEALRLDPGDVVALQGRGLSWVATGFHDGAITDLTEALRLDPNRARAYSARGSAWTAKKEYGRALDDFDAALRLDPNDADAHDGVATIRATCPDDRYRDGRRAIAAATRALELHGRSCPHCLDTMAAACAEFGDFATAVKWETKALEALPKEDPAQKAFRSRLALYQDKKPYRDATEGSTDAIAVAPPRRDDGSR